MQTRIPLLLLLFAACDRPTEPLEFRSGTDSGSGSGSDTGYPQGTLGFPAAMIQEHSLESGLGARVSLLIHAPLLTLTPPAPGGGDDPHAELYVQPGNGAVVVGPDGTKLDLPPGSLIRVGFNRGGLGRLSLLAGEFSGYLFQAYPPVE